MTDPSPIIYFPIRVEGNMHIVGNGDQTDTVAEFLRRGETIEAALRTREFEPDGPNYTPRITGFVDVSTQKPAYKLSILKSDYNDPAYSLRFVFDYKQSFYRSLTRMSDRD